MGKSYKKHPVFRKVSKWHKKYANKQCRRGFFDYKGEISSTSKSLYKRYNDSYDIVNFIDDGDYKQFTVHSEDTKKNYRYWMQRYKAK